MSKALNISHDRLKEKLSYDPETGIFVWKLPTKKIRVGDVCGTPHNAGYTIIRVDGHQYLAHRLAWFYMTGKFPPKFTDHIDGNRLNNKFSNLRLADAQMNVQNTRVARRMNKLGILGVYKNRNKFVARIWENGNYHCLGSYSTTEEAKQAYINGKRIFHVGCTI